MTESLPPHPSPPPRVRGRGSKIAFTVAKLAIVAVIIWFVYRAMHAEFSKVSADDLHKLHPNPLLVLAAGLCLAGMNTVQMLRYRSLLFAYDARPTWPQMFAIAWIPPLGKYIPGSVWSLMGAMAMLKRFGIPVAVAVSVVIMVDAFGEIIGLIFSVPLIMRPPVSEHVPGGKWMPIAMIAAGVIALSPPVFNRVIQFGLRLIKRPPLSRSATWHEYLVPISTAIAQYLFAGAALWLMIRSITPVSIAAFPWLTMIVSCAMAVGYLFFIAPGGLGVREFIFVSLLPPLLPDAPAGTIAIVTIGMRLMQVVAELVMAGLGAIALRKATSGPLAPVPGGEG